MDYEYDVFLSYKRQPEAKQWLIEHFEPLLAYYLGEELGAEVRMFRDERDTEAGADWPLVLGNALSRSRALVALCSRTYFHSEWCSREFSSMLDREVRAGLRSVHNPGGLIVPVVLHDCDPLPAAIAKMQAVYIRDCFNVRMRKDSPLAEVLVTFIRDKIAPGIKAAIEQAPPWDPTWADITTTTFQKAAENPAPGQTTVPRFR